MVACAVCSNPIIRRFLFASGESPWVHRVGIWASVDHDLDRDHQAQPATSADPPYYSLC